MLLASNDVFSTPMFIVIGVVVFYVWLAKKYAAANPDVKDAAKKAVAAKAIGVIGRLLR
jgi:hypothetical protein